MKKFAKSIVDSLVTTIFMPLRKGIGMQQLKLRPSGLLSSADSNVTQHRKQ